MKAAAAIVMVFGLTLMSAPLVLPRLGVDLGKVLGSAPASQPGGGGVASVGGAVSSWVRSAGSFLGGAGPQAAATEIASACNALSGAGGNCNGGSSSDFASAFAAATKMSVTGELPEGAFAAVSGDGQPGGPGAATVMPGARTPDVSIIDTSKRPPRKAGAKFVKARGAEDPAP